MTVCSSCEANNGVADPRALSARVWRLVHATIQDDDAAIADATGNVLDETGDCPTCLRATAVFLACEVGLIRTEANGRETTLRTLEKLIAEQSAAGPQ